jgi:hypothetical protein
MTEFLNPLILTGGLSMKINNVETKTPATMKLTLSDIDGESYRNAKGEIIRDRIAVKRKLDLEWSALTTAEISALLSKVTATFFDVTYLDALTGKEETKKFYVSERSAPVYSLVNGKELLSGLSMSFVEK